MNKLLLSCAIFLFASCVSTKLNAQTTMEEYIYVIKGYKNNLELGQDIKRGYEIIDVDEASIGERKVTLKKLVKTSPQRKTVAYIVTYKKGQGNTEYICIPHPNSDTKIRDLYWKALHDGKNDDSQRLQLVSFLLSRQMKW